MHSQCEQATAYDEDMPHERRGVKTRLIGVAMIILGVLNSLLTLRGGLPSEEYLVLIAVGAAIFAIGAVRSRRDSLRRTKHEA
jgi:hypothetical protein